MENKNEYKIYNATKLQNEWGMSATGRVTKEFMQKIIEKKGASSVQNLAKYVDALR